MNYSTDILLVEDDKDDQASFIEALSTINTKLLCNVAHNGKEALRVLNDALTLPYCIFMDVNMPLMNGIECLRQIKKNPKTRNIPVVMLTTSAGESEEALRLGAKSFIVKPDNSRSLRHELEMALA